MVRLSPRLSSSAPSLRFFFSASLVAAMRVIEISSGMIASTERPNVNCKGPRTCPQLMPVLMTAPKVRMSKKLSHIHSRSSAASSSSLGESALAAWQPSGSSLRTTLYALRCCSFRIAFSVT